MAPLLFIYNPRCNSMSKVAVLWAMHISRPATLSSRAISKYNASWDHCWDSSWTLLLHRIVRSCGLFTQGKLCILCQQRIYSEHLNTGLVRYSNVPVVSPVFKWLNHSNTRHIVYNFNILQFF